MGQTLSEPVTNKETAICQDDNYKVSGYSDDSQFERKLPLRYETECFGCSRSIALL